jgi:methionine synthase II (cobalamin-independent)
MAHVYRADTIGSLLRPQYLKLAREQCEAGQLETAAYKEIEDRAVDQAIAMQEGVGLDVVTDGELRRHTFIDQLTEQVEGLTLDSGDSGHVPVPIHDEAGQLKSVFTIPLSVTDKLQRSRMMTVEEYSYARARARRPVKVTLPSPLMLFLVWSPQRSRDAYPDPFEMFADGLRLKRRRRRSSRGWAAGTSRSTRRTSASSSTRRSGSPGSGPASRWPGSSARARTC